MTPAFCFGVIHEKKLSIATVVPDFIYFKINILNSKPYTFHQPETTSIKQFGHKLSFAVYSVSTRFVSYLLIAIGIYCFLKAGLCRVRHPIDNELD